MATGADNSLWTVAWTGWQAMLIRGRRVYRDEQHADVAFVIHKLHVSETGLAAKKEWQCAGGANKGTGEAGSLDVRTSVPGRGLVCGQCGFAVGQQQTTRCQTADGGPAEKPTRNDEIIIYRK